MPLRFEHITALLARIERLAGELQADPDGHLHRSTTELRTAFDDRSAVEPAVGRVRDSVRMVRRGNQEGSRREFHRRAHGVDHLDHVVEDELIPQLRRIGFEVCALPRDVSCGPTNPRFACRATSSMSSRDTFRSFRRTKR